MDRRVIITSPVPRCWPRANPAFDRTISGHRAIDSIAHPVAGPQRGRRAGPERAAPDVTLITGDMMLWTQRCGPGSTRRRPGPAEQTVESRIRLVGPDVAVTAIGGMRQGGLTSDTVGIGTTLVFVRERRAYGTLISHRF
jgi:hypothetical protein